MRAFDLFLFGKMDVTKCTRSQNFHFVIEMTFGVLTMTAAMASFKHS